jgi:signal transduction histidine kinase
MTNPSVLLIDDESNLLIGLSAVMRRSGYEVRTAGSGQEGLREIARLRPDVVVCDVMMPPPDGFEVRRTLSSDRSTANIPFLFLTARADPVDRIRGLQAGADDYLVKPFDREELLARIGALLRRHGQSRDEGRRDARAELESLRSEATRNIHHELKTPLSIVIAALEIAVESDGGREGEDRSFYEDGLRAAHHLTDLIRDLTRLREIDDGERAAPGSAGDPPVWLAAAAQKCRDHFGRTRVVDVRIRCEPGVVPAGPAPAARHVVEYLLDNAVKFGPPGEPVDLALERAPDGRVLITVSDRGPGIPPAFREKVFDRWFQVSHGLTRRHGGLGIGLTLARALARDLGGDVAVLDTDEGCTVAVTLPAATGIRKEPSGG